MSDPPIDWQREARDIALRLWGDPSGRTKREWRWGRRGSRKLDLARGTWSDFETGETGQAIHRLVMRELRCDARSAAEWVRGGASVPRDARPREARPEPPPDVSKPRGLWSDTIPAEEVPGDALRRYLSEVRRVWPEGASPPDDVRWLPRESFRHVAAPPQGTAGAMALAYRRLGGKGAAIQLDALTADGERATDGEGRSWRRFVGAVKNAFFDAACGEGVNGFGRLAIAEGPLDALACRTLHPDARCIAAGSAGAMASMTQMTIPAAAEVIVHADSGEAGRRAGNALRRRLEVDGMSVTVVHRVKGDPASEVAASW